MSAPIFSFRPPVVVEERVVRELCRLARNGYETRYKKETFGFVFGTLKQNRQLIVRRAVHYRGGGKGRTGVWFDDWPSVLRVLNRREDLAQELRMRFLGGFHSHVEIAGRVFRGLSTSDRHSIDRDPHAALEMVVFVWAGGRSPGAGSTRTIAAFEPDTGYSYRVRVYAKRRPGIRQIPVRVPGTHNVILL